MASSLITTEGQGVDEMSYINLAGLGVFTTIDFVLNN